MGTNFFIDKINVKFPQPDTGNDYQPIVYKYNKLNQIAWGLLCGPSQEVEPVKIHQANTNPASGNSFISITTPRGQYQIYWNDGGSNNYSVLLQSLTTSNPYPKNQYNLWTGSNANQNFTLNIDMTALSQGNGISLTPSN